MKLNKYSYFLLIFIFFDVYSEIKIIFGSYSLYWFSISLVLGILIGSYSSILLAPSLLINEDKSINYEIT